MSALVRARRIVLWIAAGFLAGVGVTVGLNVGQRVEAISFWGEEEPAQHAATPTPAAAPRAQGALSGLPDFTDLAEKLSPAVVNISTTSQGEAPQMGGPGPFGKGDPHEFFEPFERFFGPMPKHPFKQRSLGSGFIINRDGYILTNNHVIENADEIIVKLENEKEYKARWSGAMRRRTSRSSRSRMRLISPPPRWGTPISSASGNG